MDNKNYMEMLLAIDTYGKKLIIEWNNGLKVKCNSFTGIMKTDIEPNEDNFIGEYTIGANEVEVLNHGRDESVLIYNDCIEISLKCIPQKVSLEDGTVLWENTH